MQWARLRAARRRRIGLYGRIVFVVGERRIAIVVAVVHRLERLERLEKRMC